MKLQDVFSYLVWAVSTFDVTSTQVRLSSMLTASGIWGMNSLLARPKQLMKRDRFLVRTVLKGETLMNEEQWNEYLERSRTWSIRLGHDLLHGEAYKALKYGPAIKVLNWFQEKIRLQVNKKRRGKDRYQRINDGKISFTYREARLRGLSSNQFSKALKELYRLGFIDVTKHGSILMGDYSLFGISEKWRKYGTNEFSEREFPQSAPYGFRVRKNPTSKR